MGSRSIVNILRDYPTISNINVESDCKFSFQYNRFGELPKIYSVYMPTREDYEVSIEVVERAADEGANIIVYDTWIKPTISGQYRANGRNIHIYSYGAFINRTKKSESL